MTAAFGGIFLCERTFLLCLIDAQELVPIAHNYKALRRPLTCY
jgi:hypothetical protein